jgi:hypothetical protein
MWTRPVVGRLRALGPVDQRFGYKTWHSTAMQIPKIDHEVWATSGPTHARRRYRISAWSKRQTGPSEGEPSGLPLRAALEGIKALCHLTAAGAGRAGDHLAPIGRVFWFCVRQGILRPVGTVEQWSFERNFGVVPSLR